MKARYATKARWALTALVLTAASTAAADLNPDFPDPFCPPSECTEISFSLPAPSHVVLEVKDFWGNVVATLVDGYCMPGAHMVLWCGGTTDGDTASTGEYMLTLEADSGGDEESCVVFCGNDLNGPFRRKASVGESAVAFAVGLESMESVDLFILEADGITLVRTIPGGEMGPGVHTIAWDLMDEEGGRVLPGSYICRLATPSYSEDILFFVSPTELVSYVPYLRDGSGALKAGSLDSLSAAVLEDSIAGGRIEFSRPLGTAEFQEIWDGFIRWGSLGDASVDSVLFVDSSDYCEFPAWNANFAWDLYWGQGAVACSLSWVRPDTFYFHFDPYFEVATWTDTACQIIFEDTLDWRCSSRSTREACSENASLLKRDDPPLPTELVVNPACPNPIGPGATTHIQFELPAQTHVGMVVIDSEGYLVTRLIDGFFSAGVHLIIWEAKDSLENPLPQGFYRIICDFKEEEVRCGGDVLVSDSPTAVGGSSGVAHRLYMNEPNPFNPSTSIRFTMPERAEIDLALYDAAGCRVAVVASGVYEPGEHVISWDGRDDTGREAASGIYFARLRAGDFEATRKLVLIR